MNRSAGIIALVAGSALAMLPVAMPAAAGAAALPPMNVTKLITVVKATKTVDITVNAGMSGINGGENFDGYYKGQWVVTVPLGWHVTVKFWNVGSITHSAMIESTKTSLDSTSPKPAFKGAETPKPSAGTAPKAKATFTFVASTAGTYRLACGVPGHAALGMWDTFIVKKGITTPTSTRKL
jgi:uncharacterized cupredoxin-like copper-binding protein